MNECFFIGKIIGDVEFKFIHQKRKTKNNSIVLFQLETLDKNILRVKAYDEIADFCYSSLNNNDITFIVGKLETGGIITIKFIEKLK